MANKKGSRQLTWTDRISIEALKKAGHSVIEIAEQLGVHRSTIYNELKRGEYMHRNSDYTETLSYSPNKAQMKAEENLKMSTLNSTFFHVFIVLPFCTIRSLFYCVFSLLDSAVVRLPLLPASHVPYFCSYASCFTSSSNSSPAE